MTEPPRHVLHRWASRAPRPTPKHIHTRTHGEWINPAAPYSPECRNIPCSEHKVRPGCLTLRGCNMWRSSCQAKYNRLMFCFVTQSAAPFKLYFFVLCLDQWWLVTQKTEGSLEENQATAWCDFTPVGFYSLHFFFFLMFIEKLSSKTMVYTI